MGQREGSTLEEAPVVESLKKGSRVTGPAREKLASDLKKKYEGGSSIRALAESTGRSYGFVHRMLTESGVQLRGRGGATRGKKAAAARSS
jgi:hypothetical protein